MRPSIALGLLAASTTSAIKLDNTVFLLFSTSRYDLSSTPLSQDQYQTAESVAQNAGLFLDTCPTDHYLIINQPEFHVRDAEGDNFPNLRRAFSSENVRERMFIPKVLGPKVDGDALAEHIRSICNSAIVKTSNMTPLPTGDKRETIIADNDLLISQQLNTLPESYTVIVYTGNAIGDDAGETYNPEFEDHALHMELKRQLGTPHIKVERKDEKNETWPTPPDLSDKNWFFTHYWINQAQLMVLVLVVAIIFPLLFAIRSIHSITVPAGAFDSDYVRGATSGKKERH